MIQAGEHVAVDDSTAGAAEEVSGLEPLAALLGGQHLHQLSPGVGMEGGVVVLSGGALSMDRYLEESSGRVGCGEEEEKEVGRTGEGRVEKV